MTYVAVIIVGGIVAVCASAIIAGMLLDVMEDGDESD